MKVNYYEIDFGHEWSMVIKGIRKPTIEEAEEFCKNDVEKTGWHVIAVGDAETYDEVAPFFDMSNDDKFPVFGI
jgi:hypothetical protein